MTHGKAAKSSTRSGGEDAAQAPTAIGRYLVLGLVGKGAMGDVYAAYDPELNRKVAIKVLRSRASDSAESAELRLRMMREAQAIANQLWSFTPTGDGYYKFSPASNSKASLDVPQASKSAGVAIEQWTYTGGPHQQWNIVPAN